MTEPIDWSLTTWEGNRRRQHAEFRALSFREKLLVLEQMAEVAEAFSRHRPESAWSVSGGRKREDPPTGE